MSFFPAFINLTDKRVLIVGGGRIAAEKAGRLLDFTCRITVISPEVSKEMEGYIETGALKLIKRRYKSGDLKGFMFVIVGVDDLELQKEIHSEAKREGVLCNSVDSVDFCDFIFPSYIKRGDLTVAVSSSGASPSLSKYLRKAIENLLPSDVEEFLNEMRDLRSTISKGKERRKLLDKRAFEYINEKLKLSDSIDASGK